MMESIDAAHVVIVTTTVASLEEARDLAGALVAQRLAACVQIATIDSVYRWAGAIERAPEHALTVKTLFGCVARVEAYIRDNHAYDLPEILVTPTCGGAAAYLDWVRSSVDVSPSSRQRQE